MKIRNLIRIFGLLLLLAGYITAQTCMYSDDVTPAGTKIGKSCSCYSGYYSSTEQLSDCQMKADSLCTFHPAAELTSNYGAYIDQEQSNTLDEMLTLVIRAPLVKNRLDASISFVHGDEKCAYPGEMWSKKVDTCEDVFTLHMPLSEALTCGFTRKDEQRHFILSAGLKVSQIDKIGDLRGTPLTRTTESVLRMELRFPKRTVVASETKAPMSNDVPIAALTQQSFDPSTSTGFLEYLTMLPYPLRVSGVSQLNIPAKMTANSVLVDVDCTDTIDSICYQKILVKIDASRVCTLTGQYNVTIALACRSETQPCHTAHVSDLIASRVTSEDFCFSVSHDISLRGDLTIYQDPEHLTLKKAFMNGQRAYFLASVSAQRVKILATKLRTVFVTPAKDRHAIPIYTHGLTSLIAQANAFVVTPHTSTSIGFEIDVSIGSALTDLFAADVELEGYEFTAEIEVAWEGPFGIVQYKNYPLATSLHANHVPKSQTCQHAVHSRAIDAGYESTARTSGSARTLASCLMLALSLTVLL